MTGRWSIHARVPAEVGAPLREGARSCTCATCVPRRVVDGGPAGPVHRLPSATNVDALHVMAESSLANDPRPRTGGDRYQIVVNVDETTCSPTTRDGSVRARRRSERWRRRRHVGSGATASTVLVIRRKDGTILAATDKTRAIPRRVRRMVHARDKGCRFPGCGQRAFVEAHHIHHRAHGRQQRARQPGRALLVPHRLVHESGWRLRFDGDGNVVVTNPVGNVIPSLVRLRGEANAVERRNRAAGIVVDATAITPRWYGDPLDLGHITARSGAPTSGRGSRLRAVGTEGAGNPSPPSGPGRVPGHE